MISRRINLIPYPWQMVERTNFRKRLILIFFTCFVFLVWLHLLQLTHIQKHRSEIRNYHSTQDEIKYRQLEIEKMRSDLSLILGKKDDLKKRVELIENTRIEKVNWTELLRKLTSLIPEKVWLSEFSVSELGADKKDKPEANLQSHAPYVTWRKINITGSSLESQSISKFVSALESSSEFAEVELDYVTKKDLGNDNIFNFEISFKFRGEQE